MNTSAHTQRQLILAWLMSGKTLTTMEGRNELDIMNPPARVFELRKAGHKIVTHWQVVDTGKGKHTIGRYALLVAV